MSRVAIIVTVALLWIAGPTLIAASNPGGWAPWRVAGAMTGVALIGAAILGLMFASELWDWLDPDDPPPGSQP